MPVASINGVNLHYEVSGQGEAIVLLHGYTGSSRDWDNQVPVLTAGYRVITLDHRGHGQSAAPSREADYSVKIFADDVFQLLGMLNIRKCCLVGHSLGGFIALEFALAHQDMLAGLVLVDTSSGDFARSAGYTELRHRLNEVARNQGMAAAFEYDAANNPLRIAGFRKHPEFRERMRQRMLATSVNGYVYGSLAIGKWQSITDRLSEINIPTLIIWGDEDLAFTEAVKILHKGIAGSRLVTVRGVGHSPHEDAPSTFNEGLFKFLEGINWK